MKFALLVSQLALISCAPTSMQVKSAVEKDPSIVFVALEKDPDTFMELVTKAMKSAQKKNQEMAMAEETKAREEQFKNPLTPVINDSRAMFGDQSAKVTIVEYTDFECPYCSRGSQTIKEVLKNYQKEVRILVKHLPLDFHQQALPAAQYYEALREQSPALALKFHDELFANQDQLKSKGKAYLNSVAKKLGANMKALNSNLASAKIQDQINADTEEARKFGIYGTPGFIINGVALKGAYPFAEFKKIIDRHLEK